MTIYSGKVLDPALNLKKATRLVAVDGWAPVYGVSRVYSDSTRKRATRYVSDGTAVYKSKVIEFDFTSLLKRSNARYVSTTGTVFKPKTKSLPCPAIYHVRAEKYTITSKAEFVGVPVVGAPGLVVQFTDLSIGAPQTWLWNFGDGSPESEEQHPSHQYDAIGSYTVTLTIQEYAGDEYTETKSDYITIDIFTGTGIQFFCSDSLMSGGGVGIQFVNEDTVISSGGVGIQFAIEM